MTPMWREDSYRADFQIKVLFQRKSSVFSEQTPPPSDRESEVDHRCETLLVEVREEGAPHAQTRAATPTNTSGTPTVNTPPMCVGLKTSPYRHQTAAGVFLGEGGCGMRSRRTLTEREAVIGLFQVDAVR